MFMERKWRIIALDRPIMDWEIKNFMDRCLHFQLGPEGILNFLKSTFVDSCRNLITAEQINTYIKLRRLLRRLLRRVTRPTPQILRRGIEEKIQS
jgi:hypothetical protein